MTLTVHVSNCCMQVRCALQALPLGPDESAAIAALKARAVDLAAQAERLRGKMVLRPSQQQYGQLQRELGRFAGSLGSIGRVTMLLQGLQVLRPLGLVLV